MYHKFKQIYQILFSKEPIFVLKETSMKDVFDILSKEEKEQLFKMIVNETPIQGLTTKEFGEAVNKLYRNRRFLSTEDENCIRKIVSKL